MEGTLEPEGQPAPALPFVAVGTLLGAMVLLTVFAGPITLYLDSVAQQLFMSEEYIDTVMTPNTVQPAGAH